MGSPVLGITLLAGVAVFMVWTAVVSIRPDADPFRTPGIRTPTTQQSTTAWLAAHRAIRPWFLGLGAVVAVLSVGVAVALAAGAITDAVADRLVLGGFGLAVAGVAAMIRPAHRAARRSGEGGPP